MIMTESSRMTPLGTMLRHLRMGKGVSQNGLARLAGVDPAYVNQIERAPSGQQKRPTRRVVLAFAEALILDNIEADRLLIAGGYCPEIIERLTEQQLRALYGLLGVPEHASAQLDVAP